MSDFEKRDYEAEAASRLTGHLRRSAQPGEMVKALVSPLNNLEDAFKRIYDTYDIYNATGIELDRFGAYVGEIRNSRDDDSYRLAILARKFSASGSGTISDIIKLARAITANAEVTYIEHFPAAFMLHVSGPGIPASINETIQAATVAGVRSYVTHDYGDGAFELGGIDTSVLVAMGAAENTALQVDVDTAMGVNKGSASLGGSYLSSVLDTSGDNETSILQALDKNSVPSDIMTDNGDFIATGTNAYIQGGPSSSLGGAFTKEG